MEIFVFSDDDSKILYEYEIRDGVGEDTMQEARLFRRVAYKVMEIRLGIKQLEKSVQIYEEKEAEDTDIARLLMNADLKQSEEHPSEQQPWGIDDKELVDVHLILL